MAGGAHKFRKDSLRGGQLATRHSCDQTAKPVRKPSSVLQLRDIPMASAASSIERPAKKRSLTSRAFTGSSVSSTASASIERDQINRGDALGGSGIQ